MGKYEKDNLKVLLGLALILGPFFYFAEYPKEQIWSPTVSCKDITIAVKRIVSAVNKGGGDYFVTVVEDTPLARERLIVFGYGPVEKHDMVYFSLSHAQAVTMDVQPRGLKLTKALPAGCN